MLDDATVIDRTTEARLALPLAKIDIQRELAERDEATP